MSFLFVFSYQSTEGFILILAETWSRSFLVYFIMLNQCASCASGLIQIEVPEEIQPCVSLIGFSQGQVIWMVSLLVKEVKCFVHINILYVGQFV